MRRVDNQRSCTVQTTIKVYALLYVLSTTIYRQIFALVTKEMCVPTNKTPARLRPRPGLRDASVAVGFVVLVVFVAAQAWALPLDSLYLLCLLRRKPGHCTFSVVFVVLRSLKKKLLSTSLELADDCQAWNWLTLAMPDQRLRRGAGPTDGGLEPHGLEHKAIVAAPWMKVRGFMART